MAETRTTVDARRQGRIVAMQALYEADLARHDLGDVLERLLQDDGHPRATRAFAGHLVAGVTAHLDAIDPLIAAAAPTWPLAQMAKIDKSILRLAVYEVLFEPDVPYKAAINEAVEIAKLYGSDSSPRFVNGVLGTIAARREADRPAATAEATPKPDDGL